MATTTKIFKPGKPDPATPSPLQSEALQRIADAKQEKQKARQDIEDAYYFAAPRRIRSAQSGNTTDRGPGDARELHTSLGFECAEDFMTMAIESFLPQSAPWAERKAPAFMPAEMKGPLETDAKKSDEQIFQLIRASNFHPELAKQGVPDGAIGVFAMLIQEQGRGLPPRCLGVPIRELEINLGPDGRIDDRFVVKPTKYRHIAALLPDVTIPEKYKDEKKKNEKCTITWGYWRLWAKIDDEYWQHVVLIDDEVVHKAELKGEGCCPLIVGRFGGTPDFAWPEGPMIKSLPELYTIDDLEMGLIENVDFTLRPPVVMDDDGVISFGDGIQPGKIYFRRAGARDTVQEIYEPRPLDAAYFDVQMRKRNVRKLHYVDFPEQLGKTPPTLGQWLDEMVKAQKRIGTPGYAFWREFPHDVFIRFKYLAEMRGDIQPLLVKGPDGTERRVSLQAYNPAQRAQENQDVLTAMQLAQFLAAIFPQTFQAIIDDRQTMENIQRVLGDKLIVIRSIEEFNKAVGVVAQLAGIGGPRLPGGIAGPAENV